MLIFLVEKALKWTELKAERQPNPLHFFHTQQKHLVLQEKEQKQGWVNVQSLYKVSL